MALNLRRDRWTIVLIAVIVVMGLEIIYLVYQNQQLKAIMKDPKRYFKTLSADDQVPAITALDVNGDEISLRYSPTAPQTLLFWFAPTCSSCEDNIGFWNRLYAADSTKNTRYVGMCISQATEARAFIAEHEIKFPVISTDDRHLIESYQGNVLPQTVLISPEGTIVDVWPGAIDQVREEEIIALLAGL
ncbi:peroxiredoxin family protein [Candidatus Zixiibacteriota bacterium]